MLNLNNSSNGTAAIKDRLGPLDITLMTGYIICCMSLPGHPNCHLHINRVSSCPYVYRFACCLQSPIKMHDHVPFGLYTCTSTTVSCSDCHGRRRCTVSGQLTINYYIALMMLYIERVCNTLVAASYNAVGCVVIAVLNQWIFLTMLFALPVHVL